MVHVPAPKANWALGENMESLGARSVPAIVVESPIRKVESGEAGGFQLRLKAGLFLVCLLLALPALGARHKEKKLLFLVARNQIQDPFFEHSVVLILPLVDTPIEVGLIINKSAQMSLGEIFPESLFPASRTQLVHLGGPVDVRVPGLIFHSSTLPAHALNLYGDVYLNFDSDAISEMVQDSKASSKMLLFLGRAQWTPEQLANEIHRGDWYKAYEEGDLIFTSDPQALWRTLHSKFAPTKYINYGLPARPLVSRPSEDFAE